MKKTIFIEGMSCKHCSAKINENLNEIKGIKAKVDLKKNLAMVSSKEDIDLEIIKQAIEKDGYKVIKII
jgi:copper chaperone CopZ